MKKKSDASAIVNRRAKFDYELRDEFVVGISLGGPEVRAIRDGRAQLKGAFVTVRDGELWLHNASLSVRHSQPGGSQITVDTSPRKLLAHRKEIERMEAAKQEGLTIVPYKILPSGRFIKAVIYTAKGKKQYDKRETIKRREQDREAQRQVKRR
jgi:SsrA-binding protein